VTPDDPLPYRAEPLTIGPAQLRSWTAQAQGIVIALDGPCPRCAHPAPNREPLQTVSFELRTAAPERTRTAALQCTCQQPHPGRPPGLTQGCGSSWTVVIGSESDGSLTLSVPEPGPESQLLADAARALRQATPTQLADMRTAGEKWIAGITALYGLIGFAGVTGARDALVNLSTGWQVAVAVVLLIAVGLAGLAIYWAYQAAYGWPKTRPVRDDEELVAWYEAQLAAPERAASYLRQAVRYAAVSLAALVVLTGIIWFAPQPAAPGFMRVTRAGGAIACGTLLSSAQPRVLLIQQVSGAVVAIPLAQVAGLSPVTGC